MADENPTKICTRCKQEFPATLEFFRSHRHNAAGMFSQCRDCERAGQREHKRNRPPEYNVWQKMKNRCFSPTDKSYRHYGGRGITVCHRWLDSYEAFYEEYGTTALAKTFD